MKEEKGREVGMGGISLLTLSLRSENHREHLVVCDKPCVLVQAMQSMQRRVCAPAPPVGRAE